MRAAVIEAVRTVAVKEVDMPSLDEGGEGGSGLLLEVKACAVCGTDVRIFTHGHDKVRFPWTTGHEMSGVVADIAGIRDTGVRVGDRVNVDCTEGCGGCDFCRAGRPSLCPDARVVGYHYPGAFAEYVRVPASIVEGGGVYRLSPEVGFPEGSIIEPIAAAINGHERIEVDLGETVVIVGAGPLGYVHAILCRLRGAARVIMVDVMERRLGYAEEFGVDATVDSSKVDPVSAALDLTEKKAGADVVIVACSAPQACLDALRMIRKRGRVLFFAGLPRGSNQLPIDVNLVHYSEAALYGCFGATRRSYDTAYKLVNTGAVPAAKLVTHVFPLDRIQDAFRAAESGEGLRVVVCP